MFSLKEIFFQPLKCQPNINSLRIHRNPLTGSKQIILIGLDGSGMIVEYIAANNEWKTYSISLPEVQQDCRVLSVEILPVSRFNLTPAIIYGYAKTTTISNNDDSANYYFDRAQILDNTIKPTSLSRVLNFAPKFIKAIVTKNFSNNENETVLIVAGAEKLLFFNEKNERSFQDITKVIDNYLPELKNTSGNVCTMDTLVITDSQSNQIKQRLIVCGHSNGLLDLYITDIQSDGPPKTVSKTLEYDSFISSVKFFYHNHKPNENEQPYLLVTSAIEPAVIYRNVLVTHLSDPIVLEGTDNQDCLTCSSIGDVDLDGKNEILLGTFGKAFFVCRIPIENDKRNQINGLTFPGETVPVCRVVQLAASAFGLIVTDLTNDSLNEIILATTRGLHIYQLDLTEVTKLIENRLEKKTPSIDGH